MHHPTFDADLFSVTMWPSVRSNTAATIHIMSSIGVEEHNYLCNSNILMSIEKPPTPTVCGVWTHP